MQRRTLFKMGGMALAGAPLLPLPNSALADPAESNSGVVNVKEFSLRRNGRRAY